MGNHKIEFISWVKWSNQFRNAEKIKNEMKMYTERKVSIQ